MKKISHEDIKRMFISASIQVKNNKEKINMINVFPVPDQDTGNNLHITLNAVNNALIQTKIKNISHLKEIVLDAALTSASGNIGVITTGFLSGFFSELNNTEVEMEVFAQAFMNGSKKAYESIQDPKEGTVLDVIKSVAYGLKKEVADRKNESIIYFLEKAVIVARDALNKTQEKMSLYKKVSVVDAGGYGFLLMIEGFLIGIAGKTIDLETADKPLIKPKKFIQILSKRYEVVSLLGNLKYEKKTIAEKISSFGDSLDMVEANNKLKIHIHTDYPDDVVDLISSFGSVIHMKTVDMVRGNGEKKSIGIITDEAAGLPIELIVKNNIVVVPFTTSWEKVDKLEEYKKKNIYDQMRLLANKTGVYGWPKTSQPTPKLYYQAFKEQLKKYGGVLCFTISSKLSGSYNSALQGKSMLLPKERDRVLVTDFCQASAGQALLIIKALELIAKEYTVGQIEKQLKIVSDKIHLFGVTDDIVWIIKGGRFTLGANFFVKLIKFFKINPAVTLKKGKIGLYKFGFMKNSNAKFLCEIVKNAIEKKSDQKYSFFIHHADNKKGAEEIRKILENKNFVYAGEDLLPEVLTIHTGPDSLIVAYMPN